MTITPIAWMSNDTIPLDLAIDSDLQVRHPRLMKDLWREQVSYAVQLQASFTQVLVDLVARGYLTAQTPNSATNRAWVKEAVIRRAYMMIFLDFITETGDRWDRLYNQYLSDYNSWLENVSLEYDVNADGAIGSGDDEVVAPLRLTR